jgi:hypothetical protein
MIRPKTCRSFAVGMLALLATAGAASAQSDAGLRRENQRLRTQVDDLKRELDAARNRIAQLELEVEKLRQLLAVTPQTPAGQSIEERVTIDESVPHASPRALLKALQAAYLEAMLDIDPGDPETAEGNRQRTAYLRELQRWSRRMNREMKTPIEWHVRVAGRSAYPPEAGDLKVEAVDPETHVVLGPSFRVSMAWARARQLKLHDERGVAGVLVLKGVLIPNVTVDPERHEKGRFDHIPPLFVGPFVEFEFHVEGSSLTLPPKPQEEPGQGTPGRS